MNITEDEIFSKTEAIARNGFERNLAFIIGINNYSNGISRLKTAVNDAKKLVEVLRKKHKYQVWVCLDEVATLTNLNQLLEKTLPEQVSENDRLLFYFAGHGVALNGDDGPAGYLIPQDAKGGNTNSYLAMTKLHDALSKLPCRHFLGILDCCFAGAFRWSSTRDLLTAPEVIHKERYDRFITDAAWQIITSSASDQKALDNFNLDTQRGQVGNHSPFAAALLEALEGAADAYPPAKNGKPAGDGVITATELYLHLRDRVEIPTEKYRLRQTPGIWCLNKHDKGEYIFLSPGHELNLPPAPPLDESQNPYRGLKSFDEEHSKLFFGRTELIEKLQAFVKTHPLTVVLGASGSGKSSLVKAGLIPQLKKETSNQWCILSPIRPGETPSRALNNALVNAQLPKIELQNQQKTLTQSIAVWAKNNPNSKLLIFIDQSEEIITLCHSENERKEFFQQILTAINAHRDKLRVVLTLRSDLEPQVRDASLTFVPTVLKLGNTELKNNWQSGRFIVPAMTRSQLRACIEKPAEARVMYFQPHELVEQLIDEVADMAGALPLLSFALSELYLKYLKRQREAEIRGITIDRALTQEDYQDLGGVIQSLTQRADEEYEALVKEDPAYAQIIRHVMLRMVALGGSEVARRRVLLSELEYPKEKNGFVKEVIERFTKTRLLVKGEDAEGNLYVEPAHDALVQGWQKLLGWKQEDEKSLILQRRLTSAAVEWKMQQPKNLDRNTTALHIWLQQLGKRNQQLGLLWNANPRLDLLKQILNSQTDNWLNQVETDFVVSSLERRRNNQLRAYGLGTLVLAGVLLFAFNQWNQNEQAQSVSLGRSSKQRFVLDQQLDALVDGLKAGKTLQRVFGAPPETTVPVVTALQQVVYGVKEHNRLQGHNTAVSGVSFCNDGKTIASVSRDGIIKRWGLDGKKLDSIDGQSAHVSSVSFSRDCKMVALGSRDATITVWNLDSKKSKKLSFLKGTTTLWSRSSKKSKKLIPLKGHIISVTSVGFSPDSKLLASGTEDGTVTLWSINGDQLWTIQGHSTELNSENNNIGTVQSISFSPDGKTIASSGDYTIKLWSLDGKLKDTFQGAGYVSFSPDGKMLVSANNNYSITLWNLNGNRQWTRRVNNGPPKSVSFSSDGKTIASTSRDGIIKLWNLDGNELTTINGHGGSVNSVSFSLDGKTLAAGNEDGSIKLWSLSNEQLPTLKLDDKASINSFSFSPDGKTIALGGFQNVTIWSLDGKKLKTFEVAPNTPQSESSGKVYSLSFSPDGKSLAASANNIIQLWNLENGKELWKRPESGENYSSSFTSVSFSPDGKIATPGGGKSLKLFSLDGKELKPLTLEGYSENDFSFSPDGKTLVARNNDNTIQRWRTVDSKPLRSLENEDPVIQGGSKTQATSISFSPDSKILASGSYDGSIRLWNLENGEVISPPNRHTGKINSVNFSPDGKILASGSDDNTIRLWSLNGTELDKIEEYKRSRAYFSPNGKILAVVSDDTVTLLNIDLNDLLKRGCDRARNYLKNNPNVSESDSHLCDNVNK